MSTIKSKKVQIGYDSTSTNNFTMYQPATPDGTLRIGVGNADNPTEVGQFNANGYKPAANTVPAFSRTLSSGQSFSINTATKVQLDTEQFDTTGDWDSTNHRYIPSVAGYYQVHGNMVLWGGQSTYAYTAIYKNGSLHSYLQAVWTIQNGTSIATNRLIEMNGTTDYLELYVYSNYTSPSANPGIAGTTMSAYLVQAI